MTSSTNAVLIAVLLIAGALALAGCVAGGETQAPPAQQPRFGGGGGNGGGFGNLTAEQRQALANERQQLAENACAGKSEGDACTMQFPAGTAGNRTGIPFGESPPQGNFSGNGNRTGNGNWTGANRTRSMNETRNGTGTMTGTCQTQAQDGKLACVTAR